MTESAKRQPGSVRAYSSVPVPGDDTAGPDGKASGPVGDRPEGTVVWHPALPAFVRTGVPAATERLQPPDATPGSGLPLDHKSLGARSVSTAEPPAGQAVDPIVGKAMTEAIARLVAPGEGLVVDTIALLRTLPLAGQPAHLGAFLQRLVAAHRGFSGGENRASDRFAGVVAALGAVLGLVERNALRDAVIGALPAAGRAPGNRAVAMTDLLRGWAAACGKDGPGTADITRILELGGADAHPLWLEAAARGLPGDAVLTQLARRARALDDAQAFGLARGAGAGSPMDRRTFGDRLADLLTDLMALPPAADVQVRAVLAGFHDGWMGGSRPDDTVLRTVQYAVIRAMEANGQRVVMRDVESLAQAVLHPEPREAWLAQWHAVLPASAAGDGPELPALHSTTLGHIDAAVKQAVIKMDGLEVPDQLTEFGQRHYAAGLAVAIHEAPDTLARLRQDGDLSVVSIRFEQYAAWIDAFAPGWRKLLAGLGDDVRHPQAVARLLEGLAVRFDQVSATSRMGRAGDVHPFGAAAQLLCQSMLGMGENEAGRHDVAGRPGADAAEATFFAALPDAARLHDNPTAADAVAAFVWGWVRQIGGEALQVDDVLRLADRVLDRAGPQASPDWLDAAIRGLLFALGPVVHRPENFRPLPNSVRPELLAAVLDRLQLRLQALSPLQLAGVVRGLARGLHLYDEAALDLPARLDAVFQLARTQDLSPQQWGGIVTGLREGLLVTAQGLDTPQVFEALVGAVRRAAAHADPVQRVAMGCGLSAGLGPAEQSRILAVYLQADADLPLVPAAPAGAVDTLALGIRMGHNPWACLGEDRLVEPLRREMVRVACEVPYVIGDVFVDAIARGTQLGQVADGQGDVAAEQLPRIQLPDDDLSIVRVLEARPDVHAPRFVREPFDRLRQAMPPADHGEFRAGRDRLRTALFELTVIQPPDDDSLDASGLQPDGPAPAAGRQAEADWAARASVFGHALTDLLLHYESHAQAMGMDRLQRAAADPQQAHLLRAMRMSLSEVRDFLVEETRWLVETAALVRALPLPGLQHRVETLADLLATRLHLWLADLAAVGRLPGASPAGDDLAGSALQAQAALEHAFGAAFPAPRDPDPAAQAQSQSLLSSSASSHPPRSPDMQNLPPTAAPRRTSVSPDSTAPVAGDDGKAKSSQVPLPPGARGVADPEPMADSKSLGSAVIKALPTGPAVTRAVADIVNTVKLLEAVDIVRSLPLDTDTVFLEEFMRRLTAAHRMFKGNPDAFAIMVQAAGFKAGAAGREAFNQAVLKALPASDQSPDVQGKRGAIVDLMRGWALGTGATAASGSEEQATRALQQGGVKAHPAWLDAVISGVVFGNSAYSYLDANTAINVNLGSIDHAAAHRGFDGIARAAVARAAGLDDFQVFGLMRGLADGAAVAIGSSGLRLFEARLQLILTAFLRQGGVSLGTLKAAVTGFHDAWAYGEPATDEEAAAIGRAVDAAVQAAGIDLLPAQRATIKAAATDLPAKARLVVVWESAVYPPPGDAKAAKGDGKGEGKLTS